jgi:hypothetical protein
MLTRRSRPMFTPYRRLVFTRRSCSVMRLWHHSSNPTSGLEENHQSKPRFRTLKTNIYGKTNIQKFYGKLS